MLKKIVDLGLKLSCGALGIFILFMVNISAGTMSFGGIYELQMPNKLTPKNGE